LDFPSPVSTLTRLRVPKNFNARDPQHRRDLSATLRTATRDWDEPPRPDHGAEPPVDPASAGEVERLRSELRAHPCHDCPDREDHARWAERWFKLDRDASTLQRRVEQRTNSVARTFDRVCAVLDDLSYLDGDAVSDRGRHLMRLYSDMDLVAAEALRAGLWDGLSPAELAAALSVLVFEARRPDESVARTPGGPVRQVLQRTDALWRELAALERDHRLDFLREPDPGFAWAAWRWADGEELDVVLEGTDLAAGDFVRWVKQVIDLAGQVADAADDDDLRATAQRVVRALRRGVVAYSSLSE
jgi:ATP-dependent RNA helicase HelY